MPGGNGNVGDRPASAAVAAGPDCSGGDCRAGPDGDVGEQALRSFAELIIGHVVSAHREGREPVVLVDETLHDLPADLSAEPLPTHPASTHPGQARAGADA